MITEYANKGVCSYKTVVDLNEDHTIKSVKVVGGCNGNSQGISSLLVGMRAEDAIARIQGIRCNGRATSCPDQVSLALKAAIKQMQK